MASAITPPEARSNNGCWKFFEDEISTRIKSLAKIPLSLISNIWCTAVGATGKIISIVTLGKHSFEGVEHNLERANYIIAEPYQHLIKFLNPNADVPDKAFRPISFLFAKILDNTFFSFLESENLLKNEIGTRLTIVLLGISVIISRIVEGVLGVGVAILPLVTFGAFPQINRIPYQLLKITGIIEDSIHIFDGIIRPQSVEQ